MFEKSDDGVVRVAAGGRAVIGSSATRALWAFPAAGGVLEGVLLAVGEALQALLAHDVYFPEIIQF